MISHARLVSVCDALIRWSLAIAAFFVPIYFAWFRENFTVFDLNKSVALHVLVGVAALAWLLRTAVSARLRRLDARVGWPLAALALVFLISTLLSIHPVISLWGSYERQQGLYNLWHYLLLFFLALEALRERHNRELLLRALLASAVFVCLYGLVQACGLDFFSWGQSSQARIFSSFGQPNFLGHFLIVMVPLTLYATAFLARSQREQLGYRFLFGLELACLLFTYSRSAWLAGAVTAAVVAIYLLARKGRRKAALAISILIVLVAAVAAFKPVQTTLIDTAAALNIKGFQRLVSIVDMGNGSNRIRLLYWKAAVKDIASSSWERKLFGYGPDTQASVYVRDYQPEWSYYESINSFPDRAHNFILDVLLQFGFAGLLALGWLFGVIVVRAFKRLSQLSGAEYWYVLSLLSALLAYAINNLFSFSLTAMSFVLYLLMALAWKAGEGAEPDKEPEEIEISFFQPLSRYVVAGASAVLLLSLLYGYNAKALVADYYYFQVKKAEGRGDCRAVMDGMEKVMAWYPVSHYYGRAYLHHGTNCFSSATTDEAKKQLTENLLEEARALPPGERQYYTLIDLAHLYSILGYYSDAKYYAEAEAMYRELLRLSPNITVAYQDYGRMKMWQGRYDEAIHWYREGLKVTADTSGFADNEHTDAVESQRAYFHELIGTVYEYEKENGNAEKEYKEAISINPKQTSSLKRLADLAYARRDIKATMEYNERAFALEPRNPLWPAALAALYKEQGDAKAALDYARKAQVLDPANESTKKLISELEKK